MLDKSIEYGKEKRKVYRGAKAVDKCCRNHGSCKWCLENRFHSSRKRKMMYENNDIKCNCNKKSDKRN